MMLFLVTLFTTAFLKPRIQEYKKQQLNLSFPWRSSFHHSSLHKLRIQEQEMTNIIIDHQNFAINENQYIANHIHAHDFIIM